MEESSELAQRNEPNKCDSDTEFSWNQEMFDVIRKRGGEKRKISEEDRIEDIKLCMDEGADINAVDGKGNTVLHVAIKKGYENVIKFILKQNVDVKIRNVENKTALMLAEYHESSEEILRLLKEHGRQNKCLMQQASSNDAIGATRVDDERERKVGTANETLPDLNAVDRGSINRVFSGEIFPQKLESTESKKGKRQSGADKGQLYELKLLMLFLKRGHFEKYNFKLGKQVVKGLKFDDIVFKYFKQGNTYFRFLQVKHIQDESKKITPEILLHEKLGNEVTDSLCEYFNLQKYFRSFLEIKKEYSGVSVKDIVIFTNIDLDISKLQQYGITARKIEDSDVLLDLSVKEKQSARYQIEVPHDNVLCEVLRECSDKKWLAKELIKHTFEDDEDKKAIRVDKGHPIFECHHIALSKEVIPASSRKKGRFGSKFIDGDANLSQRAKDFRKEFFRAGLRYIKKNFWIFVCKRKLKLSCNFGKHMEVVQNSNFHCSGGNIMSTSSYFDVNTKVVEVLQDVVDLKSLVSELVKYVFDDNENTKILDVNKNDIFRLYHLALAEEVIDIQNGKFKINFVYGQGLSETAKALHSEFFNAGLRYIEENFWEFINKRKLKLASNFGKPQPTMENSNELPTDDEIRNEDMQDFFAHLIFAVNQPNSDQVSDLIENEELKEAFNLINIKFVMTSLENEVKSWLNENKDKEGWISSDRSKDFFDQAKQVIITSQVVGLTLSSKSKYMKSGIKFKTLITGLEIFLNSDQEKILHIFSSKKDTFLISIKMCQFLEQSIEYKADDSHIFVRLENLLDYQIQCNIVGTFQSTETNLLVIEHNSAVLLEDVRKLYIKLSEVIRCNLKKKLIIIGEKNSAFAHFFEVEFVQYYTQIETTNSFSELTSKSQSVALEKEITFQGQKVSFGSLIVSNPEKVIDGLTLVQLIKGEKIVVGEEIQYLRNLDAAYTKIYDSILANNLVDALSDSSGPSVLFMISGIYHSDIGTIKKKLMKYLSISADSNEKIELIISQLGILKLDESEKRIIISIDRSDANNLENFKNLCHRYPSKRIHWVEMKRKNILWQQMYDPSFYFQRKLRGNAKIVIKNVITEYIAQEGNPDLFIFSNVGNEQTILDVFRHSQMFKKEQLNKISRKVILKHSEKAAEECFMKLRDNNESVHWMKLENKQIVWHRSHGSLKKIREYIDKCQSRESFFDELEFIEEMKKHKVVIIADEPGMGKTTTLVSLSGQMKSQYKQSWVIHLDLRCCKDAILCIPSEDMSVKDIVEFLSRIKNLALDKPLTKCLLQYKLEQTTEHSLLLFLDGFDEINDILQERKIINLLQFLKYKTPAKVWVTTRPYKMDCLENSLSLFGTKFEEFSRSQRKAFLKKVWQSSLSLSLSHKEFRGTFISENTFSKFEEFANILFENVDEALGEDMSRFIGIPLQLYLLAEAFRNKFINFVTGNELSNFNSFDVLDLYKNFIISRYDIYFKEKKQLHDDFLTKTLTKKFNKNHQHLAFNFLFSTAEETAVLFQKHSNHLAENIRNVTSFGIVQSVGEEGEYYFIHKTFAEYFAASFLADMLSRYNISRNKYEVMLQFLVQHISRKENEVFRNFFDLAIAPKSQVHIAVLHNHEDSVTDLLRYVNPEEKCTVRAEMVIQYLLGHARKGSVAIRNFLDRLINQSFTDHVSGNKECVIRGLSLKDIINELHYVDKLGRTALHLASQLGSMNVVKVLLEVKCDIFKRDDLGRTALHYAALHDHWNVVEHFLECIADIGIGDNIFCKPLHIDVDIGDCIFAKPEYLESQLVQFINLKDNNEKSSLQYAVENEHLKVAVILLHYGADTSVMTDKEKEKILSFFNKYYDENLLGVFEFLLLKVPLSTCKHYLHPRFLFHCFSHGHTKVIDIFFRTVRSKRKRKWIAKRRTLDSTPLDKFTESCVFDDIDHLKIVKYLITNGVIRMHKSVPGGIFHSCYITKILVSTAKSGNIETFKYLIANDKFNCHIHMSAALKNNQQEIVEYLWKNFCNETNDPQGNSAMHIAAAVGARLRAFKYLINNSASVNSQNIEGRTPLHVAILNHAHFQILEYLVENGADVNILDCRNKTPLYYVIKNGNFKAIKYFLLDCQDKTKLLSESEKCLAKCFGNSASFNPDIVLENGKPILHEVVISNDLKLTEFLIRNGADINCLDNRGMTPLHWGALLGDINMVGMLSNMGALYDVKDNDGKIPLDYANPNTSAYLASNIEYFRSIYDKDIKYEILDYIAESALIDAELRASEGIHFLNVMDMLKQGRAYNCKNQKNQTPQDLAFIYKYELIASLLQSVENFFTAVKNNNYHEILSIISNRQWNSLADLLGTFTFGNQISEKESEDVLLFVNFKDCDGLTPLHWAAKNGSFEVVHVLLKNGAQIESMDNEEWRPLHHAAENDEEEIIKLLLRNAATFNPKDKHGRLPLDLVKHQNGSFLEIIHRLFTNIQCDPPESVLSHLQNANDLSSIINCHDNMGNTLLHYAAKEDYIKIIQFLLENGAEFDVTNIFNETPLELAHHQDVLTLLMILDKLHKGVWQAIKDSQTRDFSEDSCTWVNYVGTHVKTRKIIETIQTEMFVETLLEETHSSICRTQ